MTSGHGQQAARGTSIIPGKLSSPYSSKQISIMKTVTLKINPADPEPGGIERAVSFLREGKIVAFPTDTVYGIGADVFDEKAVQQMFAVKKRDPDKPLQVLVSHRNDLQIISKNHSEMLDRLVSEFWPGPLTIVMKAKDEFPRQVRCGKDTIGVRMPANDLALRLIRTFGRPVAATSANISGFPDPLDAQDVRKYLDGKIHLILDGGPTPGSVPSTVLDISTRPPVVLREGKLTIEELNRIL